MDGAQRDEATNDSKGAEHYRQENYIWIILLKEQKQKSHRGAHRNVRWCDNEQFSLDCPLFLPRDPADVPGAHQGPSSPAQSCPALPSQPCPLWSCPCSELSKPSPTLFCPCHGPSLLLRWLSRNMPLSKFLMPLKALVSVPFFGVLG